MYLSEINSSMLGSTSTHDTSKVETYLIERNIQMLQRMFPDEATYIENMQTLWALRAVAGKACEVPDIKHLEYDKNSPYFRVWKLANDLIGALSQYHIYFECNGYGVFPTINDLPFEHR